MTEFRKEIKKRIGLLIGAILLLDMWIVVQQFNLLPIIQELKSHNSYEFQQGLLVAGLFAAIALLISYQRALKEDKELEKLYYREKDERKKTIKEKSGGSVILYVASIMILVGSIAGYFNQTVFITLVIAGGIQLLISLGLKVYYSKTL